MKIQAFPLVLVLFPSVLDACQVTLDGEDVTTEFFFLDSDSGEAYVDCIGQSKCRDVVITDCPSVKCVGSEACNSAQINYFTESVVCEGLHSCHRTEMVSADSETEVKPTVSCIGSGACDVAQIMGEIEQVTCSGVKACRKVHVEGAKLVKCQDGDGRSLACEGFATLETECLYCGKHGCADHINQCRYKILGDLEENERYEKCKPEELIGNCPDGLFEVLEMELSGREEIDVVQEGGHRKLRTRLL